VRRIWTIMLMGVAVLLLAASPIQFHNLLSTTHTDTVPYSPPVVGDLIVGGNLGKWERLAPNTQLSTRFLTMTGDGTNGAVPVWADGSGLVPRIVAKQAIVGQVGAFPPITLFLPANDGDYRISVYITSATIVNSNRVVALDYHWADEHGAQSSTVSAGGSANGLGRVIDVLRVVGGNAISIGPSVNFSDNVDTYSVYITVEVT